MESGSCFFKELWILVGGAAFPTNFATSTGLLLGMETLFTDDGETTCITSLSSDMSSADPAISFPS